MSGFLLTLIIGVMLGSGSGCAALGGIISTSIPPSLFSAAYMMTIVSAVFMVLSGGCGL